MLLDVVELEPGKTYVVRTWCETSEDLSKYTQYLSDFVPKGVKFIVLNKDESLKFSMNEND